MKRFVAYITVLGFLFLVFSRCQKMDDSYKKYVVPGGLTYPEKVIKPVVHSGRNRVAITWLKGTDPSVIKAKIYWNNYTDSVSVDVGKDKDSIDVVIDNLPEQQYTFDIVTFNNKGDKSVPSEVLGNVYGDSYALGLLNRPVNQIRDEDGDTIHILWGAADITGGAYMSEVDYVNSDADTVVARFPVSADSSEITDIKKGTVFNYRTIFLPDSLAIDTFYTAYQSMLVTLPPVEYDRTGWTALAEDYDVPTGRVPQNVLDNNISTVWHMNKSLPYPHHITIDMHNENQLNGLTFIQRTPLDGAAKLIEIQISDDGENWTSLGNFTLENTGDKQFVDLPEAVNARYFKVFVKSDYKNSTFTAIAEIGGYKR